MVKFLLQRPIAVIMAFLAMVIVGCVTYFTLPVSLLPSIDIPHIIVRVESDNTSPREIENTVTATLRRQLQQVGGLNEIKSTSHHGYATIALSFDYGVDTDLAFIEVNEKIDAAMSYLPRSTQRPRVVKAGATDIPVVYLQLSLKDGFSESRFIELAEIADNTVRRSIEQMPEVAMVDVTGIPARYIRVVPDQKKIRSVGITYDEIEKNISANNYSPGSMIVRDGYYEYNISVANQLRTIDDVKNIYLRHGDRLFKLGDIADIDFATQDGHGESIYNGRRAITMAVIKHDNENIDRMKSALSGTIDWLSEQYPDISITESRNQTELLDYTISNLLQNLVLGLILVFFITAVFMHDLRTPFVIGLSIIVALVLTMLFFYLLGISLNIISLSGLILAVGMMIDNSVIVTENIAQWRQKGDDVISACDHGTTEMITPMLSSTLTTVAVFVPLIFLSGIAGAIFTDQAFSISVGLLSSYIVGILLLPVLYSLFFKSRTPHADMSNVSNHTFDRWMTNIYDRISDSVLSHKRLWIAAIVAMLPLCWILFDVLPVEKMPGITHKETIVGIKWNENISLDENRTRINSLSQHISDADEISVYIGPQDFLLDNGRELQRSEAEIYIKCDNPQRVADIIAQVQNHMSAHHPTATVSYMPPENIFEKIFSSSEPIIDIRLSSKSKTSDNLISDYNDTRHLIDIQVNDSSVAMPVDQRIAIVINDELLTLYNIDYNEVISTLRRAFQSSGITTLRSFSQYMPIGFGASDSTIEQVIAQTLIPTRKNSTGKSDYVPLSAIVKTERTEDFSHIIAGKSGEYLSVAYPYTDQPQRIVSAASHLLRSDSRWDVEFSGQYFDNRRMITEMIWILVVSLLLMYFILCAQFESFVQPLIVLLEIPIDTAFALLTLWIFGYTLNLMSAIGIIVTCGIVVNDSILKLDAINQLRRSGMPLIDAIHTAGHRRLRPILMTSITTILAMVPMLFTSDMGSELQRPLAVAMIGSMIVGTLVSIFIIPLVYYLIYRNAKN